tara:strand:+ start:43485 stop:43586 length:102 start_codon:yes stop_codon:yes gene_type:complete
MAAAKFAGPISAIQWSEAMIQPGKGPKTSSEDG